MRKVLLALTLTAVGLALLLSFKSRGSSIAALGTTSTVQNNTEANTSAQTGASASPSPSATSSAASPKTSSSSSSSPSSSKKAASGTYTGTAVDTRYGPVQVQAVVSDGKLTNVNVLQVPDNGNYEDQIVSIALPELKSEALAAQSGNIDSISGATFTSEGYAQSLQAALDQAGL
ncbi:FMN-binding protein [Actinospica durhamensis]|uniref:FMN-binding protein n=1 Tax=Actinospica durhamensis TaxID=1508375 RepID=A0A941IVA0_9ACTN|nr:FMN-binding protein [Actinospica durhamensis]MBR7838888.1 FMN-binding protein [Actinospica durhamensis]